MTSLYHSLGQQNLCYLLTEEGSQETDQHCELAGLCDTHSKARCGFFLFPCWLGRELNSPKTSFSFWDGGANHHSSSLIYFQYKIAPFSISSGAILLWCKLPHLQHQQVSVANAWPLFLAHLPVFEAQNLGDIFDSFVILKLYILSVTNSWQAAFEIHTPSIQAVISFT